jgi:hypothetical protein
MLSLPIKCFRFVLYNIMHYTRHVFQLFRDKGEPKGILNLRIAVMSLFPLENESPWKTSSISDISVQPLHVFACEKTLGPEEIGITQLYYLQEIYIFFFYFILINKYIFSRISVQDSRVRSQKILYNYQSSKEYLFFL